MYDIFISYRRDGGESLAHLLYNRLIADGYTVFLDVESLRSGKFNEALYEKIENCTDFLLILPPNALDRCSNPGDWVRAEIECAIKNKKNIIPIMMRNFEFPETLPDSIKEITTHSGISANMEFFDAVMDRLKTKRMLSKPHQKNYRPEKSDNQDTPPAYRNVPECPKCGSSNLGELDKYLLLSKLSHGYLRLFDFSSMLLGISIIVLGLTYLLYKIPATNEYVLNIISYVPFLDEFINTGNSFGKQILILGAIIFAIALVTTIPCYVLYYLETSMFQKIVEAGKNEVRYSCLDCRHEFMISYTPNQIKALKEQQKPKPKKRP